MTACLSRPSHVLRSNVNDETLERGILEWSRGLGQRNRTVTEFQLLTKPPFLECVLLQPVMLRLFDWSAELTYTRTIRVPHVV
jgi:hypothetical protein